MARLTPTEQITKRIKASYDYKALEADYNLLLQVNGVEEGDFNAQTSCHNDYGDGIMRWEDIERDIVVGGRSNLIMNAAIAAHARRFSKDIEPVYSDLRPEFLGDVRQMVWQFNYQGNDNRAMGFKDDTKWAFLSGELLGIGCLQWGLVNDLQSRRPRVMGQYISRFDMGYDPFAMSPKQARYVWVAHYIEVDQARRMYGRKPVESAIHVLMRDNGTPAEAIEYVRIIEYFDTDYEGGDPTYALFVGSIDEKPLRREVNPYGVMPFSWMVGFHQPMQRKPFGRAARELASQLEVHNIEDAIAQVLMFTTVDLIDVNGLEEKDRKRIEAGAKRVAAKLKGKKPEEILMRIPAQEIPQAYLAWYEMVMRNYNNDSNTAEMDRNQAGEKGYTATQYALLDARNKENQAQSIQQTIELMQQSVEVHDAVLLAGDRHPRTITYKGRDVPLNQPEIPESMLHHFYRAPSRITIDSESVTAQEDVMRRAADRAALLEMVQALPDAFKKEWLAERFLHSYDPNIEPRSAILDQQEQLQLAQAQAMAQQMGGGQPAGTLPAVPA